MRGVECGDLLTHQRELGEVVRLPLDRLHRRRPEEGQLRGSALGAKEFRERGTLDELLIGDDMEVEGAEREEGVDAVMAVARVLGAWVPIQRQPQQARAPRKRPSFLQ